MHVLFKGKQILKECSVQDIYTERPWEGERSSRLDKEIEKEREAAGWTSQIRAWWLQPVKVCGAGMASHSGSCLGTLYTPTLPSHWMWLAPKIVTLGKVALYTWGNSCLGNTSGEVRKAHVLFHQLQAQQPPVPSFIL